MKKTIVLAIFAIFLCTSAWAGKTIKNAPGGKRTAAQLTNTMAFPLDAGTADYWTDLAEHYLWIKAQTDLLYQPLDADLTYLAGVTLSNDIKTFLNTASTALARTALGLGTGDNPSFNSVHVSGGNLAAANKQVVKAWQTDLPYVVNETAAVHGGKLYICTSSHTAGATTEPGVGADWATVWAEVQGSGSMTYPGAGIPNSTGSAWGTSYSLDTDLASVSGSDDSIPSAKATKSALDGKQAVLTNPVTGPASPTAGYLTKWGPSGQALVDGLKLGTLTDTKYCTYSTANGLVCNSDGTGTTTYPGAGIALSTGSTWGTSLTASSALQYLRKNAANDGYEFGGLPAVSGSTAGVIPATNGVTDGYVPKKQTDGSVIWAADAVGEPGTTSDSFKTIDVSSGTDPVADSSTDILVMTGTAPVTVTGDSATDTITIAMQAATTSLSGYLTSIDWNTFNNKQAAFGAQVMNRVYAGPASGSDATPTFRALVAADIPSLTATYAAIAGTPSNAFQIDNDASGPKLKFNDTKLEIKNAADDAYADIKGKDAYFANFYSTAGDGNYYLNINNTTAGGGHKDSPAEGDFDSVDAIMYIYRTSWRTIWDSGNLANPISLADSATAAQPLLSGGSGGDPAYASYVFSGTASQTYTFPSTSKTLAATDGSNLSLTSSALATALSDKTGSGVAVFATSPSLTTPNIGVATGTSLALSGALTGLVPSVVLTHASGVHDGSNDAAVMTDSGESFTTNAMVGMTLYNVTDASSCTVTANDGTTITCTLAGGTDNNWDTNDVWQVGPGPNQSGSTFYVSAASTIRHPAIAGYAAGYYVDGAVVLTVEVADAMTIEGATASAIDAGDTIDSPATANSFIWLHNKSTTVAKTHGKNGTWTDGGAS